MFRRVALTLFGLAALGGIAAYACPPAVSYSRTAVSYYQPTVSVAVPYSPTVTLAAQYAPVAAAAPCVCESPPVAAPAAYEAPPVAAPVAAAMTYAPSVSYARVATQVAYAPVVSVGSGYSTVRVGVAHSGYHVAAVNVAAVRVAAVKVGVANVGRQRAQVSVVRAKTGRVGVRERIQVKRAAVRAARAAR